MNSTLPSKWLCLMTESPYFHPLIYFKFDLIERFLQQGDEVVVFLYIDGVHLANGQQYTVNMENIGNIIDKFSKQYSQFHVYACSRCTAARGYLDMVKSLPDSGIFIPIKLYPFVKVVSVREFGKYLKNGYKLLQL